MLLFYSINKRSIYYILSEEFLLKLNIPDLKYLSYKLGQIAYRELGDGPTLFLLHGMNGQSKS